MPHTQPHSLALRSREVNLEHKKHDGSLSLVGRQHLPAEGTRRRHRHRDRTDPLDRRGEKAQRIDNVREWQASRNALALSGETSHEHLPEADEETGFVHDGHSLRYLQDTARERKNVFAALMEAVKTHSLGQIRHALYDIRGEYRRNM